jgi:hypothetical protein
MIPSIDLMVNVGVVLENRCWIVAFARLMVVSQHGFDPRFLTEGLTDRCRPCVQNSRHFLLFRAQAT